MKPLILILALAVSAFAQSTNEGRKINKWEFVSEGPLIKSYFNQDSIRRSGDIIKVWMRFELPNGSSRIYPDTPVDFGEVRTYTYMDCAKKSVLAKNMMVYDRSGNFYASQENVQGWTKETPNSVSFAVFEYFCERPSKPSTTPPKLKPKS